MCVFWSNKSNAQSVNEQWNKTNKIIWIRQKGMAMEKKSNSNEVSRFCMHFIPFARWAFFPMKPPIAD